MARRPSSERLVRLLALTAWVAEHDGATIDQAAAHFDVSGATIRRDIETLWVAGLPGGMPDQLVDFDAEAFESGRLSLREPQGLDLPVRLSRQEAVSLLLSLRVLRDLLAADSGAATTMDEAAAALEVALGEPPQEARDLPEPPAGRAGAGRAILAAVRRALNERRRLHLSYVSATDEHSERDVDPVALFSDGSHLWLRAWCLSAGAERTFRLDRVLAAQVLAAPATGHRATGRPAAPAAVTATLTLAPTGRWLVEQVPCDAVEHTPRGAIRATVTGRDQAWLEGLVLSAGRHLLSVEPPGLATAAASRARRALEADAAVHDPTPTVERDERHDGASTGGR